MAPPGTLGVIWVMSASWAFALPLIVTPSIVTALVSPIFRSFIGRLLVSGLIPSKLWKRGRAGSQHRVSVGGRVKRNAATYRQAGRGSASVAHTATLASEQVGTPMVPESQSSVEQM